MVFFGRDNRIGHRPRRSVGEERRGPWNGWMLVCFFVAAAIATDCARADSWIFQQGYYSHKPTGERIAQYAPKPEPAAPYDPTFQRSAYRHIRSSLRGADGSFDQFHVVETWGRGEYLRPYGEWQFPYRAGATPYGPWGNPRGPWTTPFGAWVNPYGLGRLPWGWGYPYPPVPTPYGSVPPGNGAGGGAPPTTPPGNGGSSGTTP
ncbi:MAG: hypothetical protein D6741_20885 [Planctomycetota bacterium]|nr:MAG: hypothetical protein D6741_20885 [Planctomycetota bacterium]